MARVLAAICACALAGCSTDVRSIDAYSRPPDGGVLGDAADDDGGLQSTDALVEDGTPRDALPMDASAVDALPRDADPEDAQVELDAEPIDTGVVDAGPIYTATYYVATDGNDATGNGSSAAPFATIGAALAQAIDGSEILVRAGRYDGMVALNSVFTTGVVIRSEVDYAAQLRNTGPVITAHTGIGITLEGFDIAHTNATAGPMVIDIRDLRGLPGGIDYTSRITLRNNVIHDSFDDDLLRVADGCAEITIEGNIFYNQQGLDEHIDINSVTDIVVQDNIFFNDFQGSGRTNGSNTGPFVVIRDQNAGADAVQTRRITLRRNVFMSWQGWNEAPFVRVGGDGVGGFEATGVTIENNLMLGNSPSETRTVLEVFGSANVTFRHNTITGDLPTNTAYSTRLTTIGANRDNERIHFFNNIWSDPTGTMVDFSDTDPTETATFTLSRNLYWNGGQNIPTSSGDIIDFDADPRAIVGDPLLPAMVNVVAPRLDSTTLMLADGSMTIRDAFVRLVRTYATPTAASPISGAADPVHTASEDILGQPRSIPGDLGALEVP